MPTTPITGLMDEMAATLENALSGVGELTVHPRANVNASGLSIDIYPGDPSRTVEEAGFADISGAWIFTVRARLNLGDEDATQDLLLRLMDDEDDLSVAAALEDDPTLNGLAAQVVVEGPSGYVPYADDTIGVHWRVRVLRAYS